ncbi:CDP-alcohol phosphatidyltransferase family protein [Anaerolentibacter hominis]|uniref:CDP-alcohol phosphatidyltransferase family protein n=1 Tax=Anaerolentibacter hominis TaxID=3079009 RepID=UPI0031B84EF0
MVGIYNYSVILTYVSLASAILGMTQAVQGKFLFAVICLAVSGLCDMFDGKIARAMKNRSDDAKAFGVQIDSLCDMVCFGAFPALLCYQMGVRGFFGMTVLILYCTTSVIRLAYFNVLEMKNELVDESGHKFYRGLPITSIAVILPLFYAARMLMPAGVYHIGLYFLMLIVGILFVLNFRFPKPKNSTLAVIVGVVSIALVVVIFVSRRTLGLHFR